MQPILKHHFTNRDGNLVSAYWYEDRYRYTVSTCMGIEYRECMCNLDDFIVKADLGSIEFIEGLLNEDILLWTYHEHQLKAKCIRCSKHCGAPRKEYNLASICNRCYAAMNDTLVSEAHVWYEINPDGSKGSVIK